jgi:TP901 family phage tail tape measure protein
MVMKLGTVEVEVRGNTQKVEQSFEGARRQALRFDRSMRGSTKAVKTFENTSTQAFRNAASAVAVMHGPLGGVASRINALGTTIGHLGVGIAALGVSMSGFLFASKRALTEFAAFEQGMKNVAAVSGATVEELKLLEAAALEAAASTRFNPQQTTQALYALASSGQEATEQISSLPAVLNLAEAGQAELGRSTELLVSSLSQFNLAATESARVADVLVAGIGASALNVMRLQVAMRNVGPTASALGLSFESTIAAVGALTTQFGNGERAGTGLRAVLNELPKVLEGTGVSVRTAEGDLVSLVDILQQLEAVGFSAEQAVAEFGAEAGPALAGLINLGSEGLANLEEELQSTGQAAKAAQEQLDTLSGDFTSLASSISVAFVEMGRAESGFVRSTIQTVTGLIRVWSGYGHTLGEAEDSMRSLAATLEFLATAGGTVLLARGINAAMTSFQGARAQAILFSAAQKDLANSANMAAKAELAAAAARLKAAQATLNAARANVSLGFTYKQAVDQLTAATIRHNAAVKAAAAAQLTFAAAMTKTTFSARALAVSMVALRGVMAALGGPVGLFLLGALALGTLIGKYQEAAAAADQHKASLEGLRARLDSINGVTPTTIAQLEKLKAEHIRASAEALKFAQSQVEARKALVENSQGILRTIFRIPAPDFSPMLEESEKALATLERDVEEFTRKIDESVAKVRAEAAEKTAQKAAGTFLSKEARKVVNALKFEEAQLGRTARARAEHIALQKAGMTTASMGAAAIMKQAGDLHDLKEALKAAEDAHKNLQDEMEASAEKVQDVVDSLEFQIEQLGRSERAQAQHNALQRAGIDLDHERAVAVTELAGAHFDEKKRITEAKEAQEELTEALERADEKRRKVKESLEFQIEQLGRSERAQAQFNAVRQAGVEDTFWAAQSIRNLAGELEDEKKKVEDAKKAQEDLDRELERSAEQIDGVVSSLKFQTEQLGRSERAQAQHNALQQAGIDINHESAETIMGLAGAHHDLVESTDAAKKAQEEFNAALEQSEKSMQNALTALKLQGDQLLRNEQQQRRVNALTQAGMSAGDLRDPSPAAAAIIAEADRIFFLERALAAGTRAVDDMKAAENALEDQINGTLDAMAARSAALDMTDRDLAIHNALVAAGVDEEWKNVESLTALEKKYEETRAKVAEAAAALFDKEKATEKAKKADEELKSTLKNVTEGVEELRRETKFQADQLGRSEREQAQFNAIHKLGIPITSKLAAVVMELVGAYFDLEKASDAAKEAQEELHDRLEDMAQSFRDVIREAEAERIAITLNERALEIFNAQRKVGVTATSAAGREIAEVIGRLHDERKAIDAAKDAQEEFNKEMERATQQRQRTIESLEFQIAQLGRSEREQARFNALQQAGVEAGSKYAAVITGLSDRLFDLEKATERATQAQNDFDSALDDMGQAGLDVIKGLVDGTMDWRDALLAIVPVILKLIQQFFALRAAQAAAQALGGPTATGAPLDLLSFLKPAVLHQGGGQADASYNRAVPARTFANAPRLHEGHGGHNTNESVSPGASAIVDALFLISDKQESLLDSLIGKVLLDIQASKINLPVPTPVTTQAIESTARLPIPRPEGMNAMKAFAEQVQSATNAAGGFQDSLLEFSGFFTAEGRAIFNNPFQGGVSSEFNSLVQVDDRFMNIPTMFEGKMVEIQEAFDRIAAAGFTDPETGRELLTFATEEAAQAAADLRISMLNLDPGVQAADLAFTNATEAANEAAEGFSNIIQQPPRIDLMQDAERALQEVGTAGSSAAEGLINFRTSAADMLANAVNDEAYAAVEQSLNSVDVSSAGAAVQVNQLGTAATSAAAALSSVNAPGGLPSIGDNDNVPNLDGAEEAATGLGGVFQKITSSITSFLGSIGGLINQLISGLGSLLGSLGKAIGSLLSAIFPAFLHEGTRGGARYGQAVSASMFSGAPRLHGGARGGPKLKGLMPDEFPAILQTGETVIPRGKTEATFGERLHNGLMPDEAPRAPNVVNSISTNASQAGNDNAPNDSGATSNKIINVLDPSIVGDYLATEPGERLIMNVIRRNGGNRAVSSR